MSRPSRVVIVSDFAHVNGGAAKVALLSARGLAESGMEVVFACAVGPISPLLDHANIEVRCSDLPEVWSIGNPARAALSGVWNRDAARGMGELLKNEDPAKTIVHFHQWTKVFSPSAIAVATEGGFHQVMTLHDYFLCCPTGAYYNFPRGAPCQVKPLSRTCIVTNCDARHYGFKVIRLLRHLALTKALGDPGSLAQGVIHVSEFARSIAEPFVGSKWLHFLVPNPIDIVLADPVSVSNNRAFVFIGRFTREKRCVLFARAARQAKVPTTFLGAGPEEHLIRKAYPEARVEPWGSGDAVTRALAKARALVFPSNWYETSGLVVLEALARGVPAIVTRCTGVAEQIQDGVNGLLCEPDDIDSLAGSLRRLQDDREAKRMGRNAFSMYWDHPHSLNAHVERLHAVYDRLVRHAKTVRAA